MKFRIRGGQQVLKNLDAVLRKLSLILQAMRTSDYVLVLLLSDSGGNILGKKLQTKKAVRENSHANAMEVVKS